MVLFPVKVVASQMTPHAPGEFVAVAWDLSVEAGATGAGAFVEAVVSALPGDEWGHILKNPGQNQINGHALDAIAYKSPTPLYNGNYFQVVDIIASVGSTDAEPQWLPLCAPVGETPDSDIGPSGRWINIVAPTDTGEGGGIS